MSLERKNYGTWDIIKLPFKYAPLHASLIIVHKLLGGLVPTFQILVTAMFLDTAMAIVQGKGVMSDIVMPITLVVLLIAYDWISWQIISFIDLRMDFKLRETYRALITEKRAKLKYKHIEDRETWDLISRISNHPEHKCKDAYNNFLGLITLIVRIGGFLTILFTQVWWSVPLIIAISIPLFYLAIKSGKATYDAERLVSKYNRKVDYLSGVLRGRESVDERSLFGYCTAVNEKWEEQYETARKIRLKVDAKYFVKMKLGSVITAMLSIFIILIFINPVLTGALTVGMFISMTNSVFDLIQMMSWQLSYLISQLATSREYLKDLSAFVALDDIEGATDEPSESPVALNTIEFKNVSFKYPGTDNYILKDISFTIEKGKHYAFVGVNGAGKTTITKLITGLYDEFEGDILINSKNIREYDHKDLKALCSVVYQDFAKYFIPFKDNISLGNINNMNNNLHENVINHAIKTIDLEEVVEKLPKGIHTPLGKIKSDGQDISGGQWQRIGMARSIVSKAPLRILDEPTAALDPISESRLYEKFEEISKGGTTIFISHRLGSTKLANEIFVIGDGTIVEKGSHEDLMSIKGAYADMYESQRSWYL